MDDFFEHEHENEVDEDNGLLVANGKQIYLIGEIQAMNTGAFMAALADADLKPGIIKINISSMGGWVEGGMAMWDSICNTTNKTITVGCGAVYSAAILPFQAGDLRLMQQSANIFFHDIMLSIGEATLGNVQVNAAEAERMIGVMSGYVAKRSGLSQDKILEMCHNETFVSAKEALEMNLCDGIIENNYTKWFKFKPKTAKAKKPSKLANKVRR